MYIGTYSWWPIYWPVRFPDNLKNYSVLNNTEDWKWKDLYFTLGQVSEVITYTLSPVLVGKCACPYTLLCLCHLSLALSPQSIINISLSLYLMFAIAHFSTVGGLENRKNMMKVMCVDSKDKIIIKKRRIEKWINNKKKKGIDKCKQPL